MRRGIHPKGEGYLYQQVKSKQIIVLLTPAAAVLLDQMVGAYRDQYGVKLSRSEYFERLARGLL